MLQLLRFIALTVLVVLLLPLIAILLFAAIVVQLLRVGHSWLYVRWYCFRTGIWCYLVCSRRRGWNEFISNNLVPELPSRIGLIWTDRFGGSFGSVVKRAVRHSGIGIRKPFLAQVGMFRIQTRSLHAEFLPFKAFRKKNRETQRLVGELLQQEFG